MEEQFNWYRIIGKYPTAWKGHLIFAYELVQKLKPKVVVELGVHWGHSFFTMAEAADDMYLKSDFYGIDTWEGDEHAGFYGEEVYETVKKVAKLYDDVNIHLVRKYFGQAVKGWDKKIDLLHIDGRHKYGDIKQDFEDWEPHTTDNAVILIHDIEVRERGFGIWKYWLELKKEHPEWKFQERYVSNGLGIIYK